MDDKPNMNLHLTSHTKNFNVLFEENLLITTKSINENEEQIGYYDRHPYNKSSMCCNK